MGSDDSKSSEDDESRGFFDYSRPKSDSESDSFELTKPNDKFELQADLCTAMNYLSIENLELIEKLIKLLEKVEIAARERMLSHFVDVAKSATHGKSTSHYLSTYKESRLLGYGGFGVVWECLHLHDQISYAVKKIPLLNDLDYYLAKQEVHILACVNHQYVVRYFESWLEKDSPSWDVLLTDVPPLGHGFDKNKPISSVMYVKMELCPRRGIDTTSAEWMSMIDANNRESLWVFLGKICIGLDAIHSSKIIHRDICTKNIFVDDAGNPKIGDFGLAVKVTEEDKVLGKTKCSGDAGNPFYRAPELDDKSEVVTISYKSDVYSLGMVFLDLLKFGMWDEEDKLHMLKEARAGNLPDYLAEYEKPLIMRMLESDQDNRISVQDLFADPLLCSNDEWSEVFRGF